MDLNSLQMDEYGEESGCIPGSFVVFDWIIEKPWFWFYRSLTTTSAAARELLILENMIFDWFSIEKRWLSNEKWWYSIENRWLSIEEWWISNEIDGLSRWAWAKEAAGQVRLTYHDLPLKWPVFIGNGLFLLGILLKTSGTICSQVQVYETIGATLPDSLLKITWKEICRVFIDGVFWGFMAFDFEVWTWWGQALPGWQDSRSSSTKW